MSFLGFIVISAFAMITLKMFLSLRRERKHNEMRELRTALRSHLDGEKRQAKRPEASDDARRITELEHVVRRAEAESRRLSEALEALRVAREGMPFQVNRKKSRSVAKPSEAETSTTTLPATLPAVFRNARNTHLH